MKDNINEMRNQLLIRILGGDKKDANIICTLKEEVFEHYFIKENLFESLIKDIVINLQDGMSITLDFDKCTSSELYIRDNEILFDIKPVIVNGNDLKEN